MKTCKFLLLFAMIFCAQQSWATPESEPNNTKATANTLAVNGSNTGAINVSGDEDWFAITTTKDGKLDVTITVSNGLNLYCYIYDLNGTTLLSSGYSSTLKTVTKVDLAAGTYYIRLKAYTTGQLPAYTVSNALTEPAQSNDAEPNNTRAQAKVLPLNNSKTGHVGYYYNLVRDTADWYKITTNADGLLRLTLTPTSGNNVYVYLYDNNGTTSLGFTYSSTKAVLSVDGLAAGIYYIKIKCYTTSDFAPYTIADSLFKPAQSNDMEPNNTPALAQVLAQDNNTTGHVGYYYNLQRDTADWYKITTNADGLLRLTLTPTSGSNVYVYLYDNNGTTQLGSTYNSTKAVLSVDGLAAGTYYVKIKCYTSSDFAPYTIADSLFEPVQTNDPEPNNTKAQATVLLQDNNTTGHVGFYYNLQRDTADWYKIITNEDGLLRLTLKPTNGNNVYVYLYDNNGTTQLGAVYNSVNAVLSVDGLAAGTYYVKIKCYSTSDFAPYTIADSLFTYSYLKDESDNSKPYQAKTILANNSTDGHVGFYYNNQRDTVDWYKINYTGSGNLDFTINLENLESGGRNNTYFQVYKDTTKAPIHSSYSSVPSRPINLTALAQGYYWIKIYTYSASDFSSYSFSNTFTQLNVASIQPKTYDTLSSCSSTNSITFQPRKSSKPYTVQLYRFGIAYGSPVITSKAYVFKNLPTGSYYAIAFGDGATGTAFGKSRSVSIEPVPANLSSTNITNVKAKLNWDAVDCAGYYTVQYRIQGDPKWTTKKTKNTTPSYLVKGLTASTTYEWQVATSDSANGIVAKGAYSSISTFTTASAYVEGNDGDEVSLFGKGNIKDDNNSISVFPNPASNYFTIRYSSTTTERVNAMLYNMSGKAVWTSGAMNASALNGQKVAVSQFASGIYYLKIMDEKGTIQSVIKVSIIK